METYQSYIQNIIDTRGQWNIPDGEYFESHHIIPRCLGGTGEIRKGSKRTKDSNIIYLYAQEHYIAHKLLALENPDNRSLVSAWIMMAYPKGKTNRDIFITPDEYAKMHKMWAEKMRTENPFLINKKPPWNKGLTKETDERLLKMSENKKGKGGWKLSDETINKMREAQKKRAIENPESYRISTNKGRVAITNGDVTLFIKKDSDMPDGFTFGNANTRGRHNMTNYFSSKEMQEHRRRISSVENNNMYGNGYKISGGNNGHAIYNYIFEGITYFCRDDLMVALKSRWPDISESTIRKIMRNSFGTCIKNKYQYVNR